MERSGTFFRVLRTEVPNAEDFECDAIRDFRAQMSGGRPRYTPKDGFALRQWSGVSMFTTLDVASRAAKRYRLGDFVAQIVLPASDGRNILFEASGRPGHYIVWAVPDVLLGCVRSVRAVL